MDFLEYPRAAKCGTTYHDCVDTITFEAFFCTFGSCNISISDDWYVNAGVLLYLTNESPVGLSGIDLCTCSSVNRKCLNTAILELFCQSGYYEFVIAPTQTGFYCDRKFDSLYHLTCNLKHQWNVSKHACSCSFTGNLLYRTTEVDIDDIGFGFFNYFSSFHH